MKIYSGKVKLIGAGPWQAGGTQLSVLEIGDNAFKRIYLPDYLGNYLKVDEDVRVLIYKSLNKHAVLAMEVNSKKYKTNIGTMTLLFILKILVFSVVIGAIGYLLADVNKNDYILFLAIALCIVYAGLKVKIIKELVSF